MRFRLPTIVPYFLMMIGAAYAWAGDPPKKDGAAPEAEAVEMDWTPEDEAEVEQARNELYEYCAKKTSEKAYDAMDPADQALCIKSWSQASGSYQSWQTMGIPKVVDRIMKKDEERLSGKKRTKDGPCSDRGTAEGLIQCYQQFQKLNYDRIVTLFKKHTARVRRGLQEPIINYCIITTRDTGDLFEFYDCLSGIYLTISQQIEEIMDKYPTGHGWWKAFNSNTKLDGTEAKPGEREESLIKLKEAIKAAEDAYRKLPGGPTQTIYRMTVDTYYKTKLESEFVLDVFKKCMKEPPEGLGGCHQGQFLLAKEELRNAATGGALVQSAFHVLAIWHYSGLCFENLQSRFPTEFETLKSSCTRDQLVTGIEGKDSIQAGWLSFTRLESKLKKKDWNGYVQRVSTPYERAKKKKAKSNVTVLGGKVDGTGKGSVDPTAISGAKRKGDIGSSIQCEILEESWEKHKERPDLYTRVKQFFGLEEKQTVVDEVATIHEYEAALRYEAVRQNVAIYKDLTGSFPTVSTKLPPGESNGAWVGVAGTFCTDEHVRKEIFGIENEDDLHEQASVAAPTGLTAEEVVNRAVKIKKLIEEAQGQLLPWKKPQDWPTSVIENIYGPLHAQFIDLIGDAPELLDGMPDQTEDDRAWYQDHPKLGPVLPAVFKVSSMKPVEAREYVKKTLRPRLHKRLARMIESLCASSPTALDPEKESLLSKGATHLFDLHGMLSLQKDPDGKEMRQIFEDGSVRGVDRYENTVACVNSLAQKTHRTRLTLIDVACGALTGTGLRLTWNAYKAAQVATTTSRMAVVAANPYVAGGVAAATLSMGAYCLYHASKGLYRIYERAEKSFVWRQHCFQSTGGKAAQGSDPMCSAYTVEDAFQIMKSELTQFKVGLALSVGGMALGGAGAILQEYTAARAALIYSMEEAGVSSPILVSMMSGGKFRSELLGGLGRFRRAQLLGDQKAARDALMELAQFETKRKSTKQLLQYLEKEHPKLYTYYRKNLDAVLFNAREVTIDSVSEAQEIWTRAAALGKTDSLRIKAIQELKKLDDLPLPPTIPKLKNLHHLQTDPQKALEVVGWYREQLKKAAFEQVQRHDVLRRNASQVFKKFDDKIQALEKEAKRVCVPMVIDSKCAALENKMAKIRRERELYDGKLLKKAEEVTQKQLARRVDDFDQSLRKCFSSKCWVKK